MAGTRPHTLGQQFRDEHPGAPVPDSPYIGILSRHVGPANWDGDPCEPATWQLEAGDTLALVSKGEFSEAGEHAGAIAEIIGAGASPQDAADAIAEMTAGHGDRAFSAAAVVRVAGTPAGRS